jgi:hypothetical protein
MRYLFQLCIALVGLGVSQAQDRPAHIDSIDILEKGIYDSREVARVPTPELASGKSRLLADLKLVKETTTIPARLGVRFGIRYKLVGEPAGAPAPLLWVVKFPEQGLRNPETNQTKPDDRVKLNRTIGDIHYRGYGLDADWEVVPGIWTFEIWQDDRKLAEQKFELVKVK